MSRPGDGTSITGPTPRVKEAHLQGRWYPADPAELARTVSGLLAAGTPRADVAAILVPHGIYPLSGAVAAAGFAAAGPRRRAVVVGPTHMATFAGAAVLPMSGYRTPLGLVRIDEEAVTALRRDPLVRANPAVFMREHSIEAQLPFLQSLDRDCALVPLLVGTLGDGDAQRLAALVRPLLTPDTLLVVSSDLVHVGRRWGYVPVPAADGEAVAAAVERLDDSLLERITARDPDGFARHMTDTGASVCGRHAIEVLLRTLPAGASAIRLGHTTSPAVTGDHTHGVGYAAVAFTRPCA